MKKLPIGPFSQIRSHISMYVCMYIYIHTYIHTYIWIEPHYNYGASAPDVTLHISLVEQTTFKYEHLRQSYKLISGI